MAVTITATYQDLLSNI